MSSLQTLRTVIGCCIEECGISDWVNMVIELNCMRVLLTLLHKVQEGVDNEDPLVMEICIT